MKALVYSKKEAPDSLSLKDVEKPVPGSGQVLIRIHSVSMNAADYRFMSMGIDSKTGIYGADITGQVEALGAGTTMFQVGDAVLGDLSGCGNRPSGA